MPSSDERKGIPPYYKRYTLAREVDLFNRAAKKKLEYKEVPPILSSILTTSATDGKTIFMNPRTEVAKTELNFHDLINHELAHVLFKTNKAIPKQLEKDFKNIPFDAIKDIYNILEDYRIEVGWGRIFSGTIKGFNDLKDNILRSVMREKGKINNPFLAILIARAFADNPSWSAEYHHPLYGSIMAKMPPKIREIYDYAKEELKLLNGTDYLMTYPVEKEILEKVQDYYKERKKKEKEERAMEAEGTGKATSGAAGGESAGKGKMSGKEKGEGGKKKKAGKGGKGEPKVKIIELTPEDMEVLKKLMGEDDKKVRDKSPLVKSESDKFPEPSPKEEEELKGVVDGHVTGAGLRDESKEKFGREVTDARERYKGTKIINDYIENNLDKVSKEYDKVGSKAKLNVKPSAKITNTLTNLKNIYKDEYYLSGKRLDINKAIQKKISPHEASSKVFHKPDIERGVEFHILLDLSGSMGGTPVDTEKEILATLYDSIIPYNKNVKIKMYGFKGNDIGVESEHNEPHVFEFDRKTLPKLYTGGNNPTTTALAYLKGELKKNPSINKNILLITDGIVNGYGHEVNEEKMVNEEIKRITNSGTNLFTIFIKNSGSGEEELKEIFKPSTQTFFVRDASESRKVLEDVIVQEIARKLSS